jgi:hypothetical protein
MRKLSYILIAFIILGSCESKKNNDTPCVSVYSENELFLLQSGDTIPKTEIDLFKIRDSTEAKFRKHFGSYECRHVKFLINYNQDSNIVIPIAFYAANRVGCEIPPPPFNPFKNGFHAYLTNKDSLYIRREITSIDSVIFKVQERYAEIAFENYRRVFFALLWDKECNPVLFRQLIEGIIKGYINVVNKECLKLYQKNLNELNRNELKLISREIPFHLRTDFYGEFNFVIGDFVPDYLNPLAPPPPPLPFDINEIDLEE